MRIRFIFFVIIITYGCSIHSQNENNNLYRVLILGNSITIHNTAPKIGWYGNWGMAASSEENDFVHLLKKELEQKHNRLELRAINIANTFERCYENVDTLNFIESKTFNANLIIIRLGENIDENLFNENKFCQALKSMINYITKNDIGVRVCITSRFWPNKKIDDAIKKTAEEERWIFADLSTLANDNENKALNQFTDKGVANHPSDMGMKRIKDKIWERIK